MNRFNVFVVAFLSVLSTGASGEEAWEKLMDKKAVPSDVPVVTNRAVTKAGKFQVVGPIIGFADRKDLYSHTPVSLGVRRFFGENHAWEIVRVNYDIYSLTSTAEDVIASTGYVVDARQAYWSVSTGYVYSPIYGKYAFGENSMVHFDGYIGLSLGTRFARSTQFFAEPFFGMQHYLTSYFAIVLPEVRIRLYSEDRMRSSEFVSEFLVQMGVSWLF